MKHKHSKLIKLLAEDTSLIKLHSVIGKESWYVSTLPSFSFSDGCEYVLSKDENLDAALAYLNGASDIEVCQGDAWGVITPECYIPAFHCFTYRVKNQEPKLEPHELRVIQEKEARELDFEKLNSFIYGGKEFETLNEEDQSLLRIQADTLCTLIELLELRIKRFARTTIGGHTA